MTPVTLDPAQMAEISARLGEIASGLTVIGLCVGALVFLVSAAMFGAVHRGVPR